MSELANIDDLTDEQVLEKLIEYGEKLEGKSKLNTTQKEIYRKKLKHIETRKRIEKEKETKRILSESKAQKKRRKTIVQEQISTNDSLINVTFSKEDLSEHQSTPSATSKLNNSQIVKNPISPLNIIEKKDPIVIETFDVANGQPFHNLNVSLYGLAKDGIWKQLAERKTDEKGMCPNIITRDMFTTGLYKIQLATGNYYENLANLKSTLSSVEVMLNIEDDDKVYHVKIFATPNTYSIYLC